MKEKEVPILQIGKIWLGLEHPLKRVFPKYLDYDWHPQPTMQNLGYSHSGFWALAPKAKGDMSGPYYLDHIIARIEPYIDMQGKVKEAVAYGRNMNNMKIWFDLEEVRRARGTWIFPDTPYFFNGRIWENKFRREHKNLVEADHPREEDDPRQGQSQKPRRQDNNGDRNRGKNSQKPRYNSDWDDEEYDRPGRSSGAGRASRPNKYDNESKPGHRSRDNRFNDRSHSRDRAYSDRSQSRERTRGNGAARDRKNHYGGRS